VLFFDKITIH